MRNILRFILVIIMIITGTYAYFDYSKEQSDNEVYENVDQYINPTGPIFANPEDKFIFSDKVNNSLENVLEYQQKYDWESLLALNKDIVGWLTIPDNDTINFPVVQGTNNSYYLTHDYTKQWNGNGNAFVDYKYNKFCLSKVIYGHNMSLSSTNPIFTSVVNWKEKDYFDSHRTLYYTEANGMTKKYLIVAIAHFNVAANDEFSYLQSRFETEEEFRSWVQYIENHSTYFDLDGNEIDYRADEVLILSTCDRRIGYGSNGRTTLFCINLTNNELDEEMN